MKRTILPVLSLVLLSTVALVSAQEPAFDEYWHDGKAELDGYRWTGSRYGETRDGWAVMVFVTEPFSRSKFVKVEDPRQDSADTFDALKLNLIREFQTGIYDYNTMTSVFDRSVDFEPVKITFSSAEWCGHVFQQLLFRDNQIEETYLSYFENESGARTFPRIGGGLAEDNLFILLRGLRRDFLPAGEERSFPFIPGAFHRRVTHGSMDWTQARIRRSLEPETVEVPAGSFSAIVYMIETEDGRVGRFHVEEAHPHRILRWVWTSRTEDDASTGVQIEAGELTGTARLKYWELNRNGHESYLSVLGLPSPPD